MTDQGQGNNEERRRTKISYRSAGVPVYGLGFVGALIYFIQHAATFGMGVLGVLKAMVWPALVVYRALEMLKL